MGAYVNPPSMPKEQWLEENAREGPLLFAPAWPPPPQCLFVCLVYNRGAGFTAAGITYSQREYQEFSRPDDARPKVWYIVDEGRLHTVSPELQGYLMPKGGAL